MRNLDVTKSTNRDDFPPWICPFLRKLHKSLSPSPPPLLSLGRGRGGVLLRNQCPCHETKNLQSQCIHSKINWSEVFKWAFKRLKNPISYVSFILVTSTLQNIMHSMLWSAICNIIPWSKVNPICYMSIFIHVAFKNVCAMPKSIYNMGNCICHMLTFVNVIKIHLYVSIHS